MQHDRKSVWSIPYVSVAAFFPSLKQNFIAYRSSKVCSHPDCIFEIEQLWQSGFSRVYSNCCCSCSFEPEIGQSSHKMYSDNIVNFQESTAILNARTKKFWKLIEGTTHLSIYLSISCHADCTDFPDPLSPLLSIVYGSRLVFQATSRIWTEILFICHSWSSNFCSSIWRGPQAYIVYVFILISRAVSCISRSSNLDSFHDGW